jgi:hypothetical protein
VNRTAVVATALGLVGVFVALAVSVVNARRPLDARVSESFDATISRRAGSSVPVRSLGCTKERPLFYACSAEARPRLRSGPVLLRWRLWLREDGCWSATPIGRVPPVSAGRVSRFGLRTLDGCNAR